jgi:hypothetical protein
LAPIVLAPLSLASQSSRAQRSSTLAGLLFEAPYAEGSIRASKATALVAAKALRAPAQIRFEWVAADGTSPSDRQVTQVVRVEDPQAPGMPLFLEETRFRLVARSWDGVPVPGRDGILKIDESPNREFPEQPPFPAHALSWQLSYQRDKDVATDLRAGQGPERDLSRITLTDGRTPALTVRSLAGTRARSGTSRAALTWAAELWACDARATVACDDPSSATERFSPGNAEVEQWVDQRTFQRGQAGGVPPSSPDPNGVIDWLEAATWATYADFAGRGGAIGAAAAGMNVVGQILEPERAAYAETPAPGTIHWRPRQFLRAWEIFRWDSVLVESAERLGIEVTALAGLTSTALHEARHSWVLGLENQDGDGFPTWPAESDPVAARLTDSMNDWLGGLNPESHTKGEGPPDPYRDPPVPVGATLSTLSQREMRSFSPPWR